MKRVIAIDGPAGAGKSTVARRIAAALGYLYVDTGAMYRAMTLKVLMSGVHPADRERVAEIAQETDIALVTGPDGAPQVVLDGIDVTSRLREPEIDAAVSTVAAVPEVRERLLAVQRKLAERGGVVLEGRDTGTHVAPDADLKVFLTASPAERARRRYRELVAAGHQTTLAEVERDLRRRDEQDMTRSAAPLQRAPDAIELDTTGRSIDAVVEEILRYCREDA
ncbi:MAG TPA: (d)CMP kinase [Thermaerobacter sp.]